MRRARSRRRRGTPFRAWGLTLTVLAILLATRELWRETAVVVGMLAFYLLVVRLTRCRVETTEHKPCRWRVRGLLGTCDYHVGYKRSLPVLVRGAGFLGLPTFMWQRDDFVRTAGRAEPQPALAAHGMTAAATKAKRSGYDHVMMIIAVVGVVVAFLALVRDLIAG